MNICFMCQGDIESTHHFVDSLSIRWGSSGIGFWPFLGLLLDPLGTTFCEGLFGRKVKRKKAMVIHHIIFTAYGDKKKSYRGVKHLCRA